MMCLLDAERLKRCFEINVIPHCAPDAVYELLWHGKPLDEALAIAEERACKRKALKAGLGVDVLVNQDDEPSAAPKMKAGKQLALPSAAVAADLFEHDVAEPVDEAMFEARVHRCRALPITEVAQVQEARVHALQASRFLIEVLPDSRVNSRR